MQKILKLYFLSGQLPSEDDIKVLNEYKNSHILIMEKQIKL